MKQATKNPGTDEKGRPWARLSDLKPGDVVAVDGDFPCLEKGARRTVKRAEGRRAPQDLYIDCAAGRHYLDGQLDDPARSDALIGLYPATDDREVKSGEAE